MKLTILGCGASVGVPVITCDCAVCKSVDPKNKRTRSSALLTGCKEEQILIDVGPDFRNQFLRYGKGTLDGVIITHCHFDHVGGLDELRPFCFRQKLTIPLYIREEDEAGLKRRYDYIFDPDPSYLGSPPPNLVLTRIEAYKPFQIGTTELLPFEVQHGSITALGIKCGSMAYIPDCSDVPEKTRKLLDKIDCLIIDGIWPHPRTATHFSVKEAVEFGQSVQAKRIFITHMSCRIDYNQLSKDLPAGAMPCHDGLVINF